jgi:hypothetical protein
MEGVEEPFILAPDFSQFPALYLGQGLSIFTEQCVSLAIGDRLAESADQGREKKMGIGWGSELSLASLASDPTAKLFSRAAPDMRLRLRPLSNISLIHADNTPDDSYAPSNAHLAISLKLQPSLRESGRSRNCLSQE